TDGSVSMIMVYFEALVAEMASYLAGTPTAPPPQLDDLSFQRIVKFSLAWTTFRLCFKTLPTFSLIPAPPSVKHFPVNLRFRTDVCNRFSFQLPSD
ncbi:MAG: hypothetical protein V1850_01425, partial [Candidatus Bathyarchaeota archaeon]